MSGFRNILPRTSEAEHKTNCLFASVGAKAIQNGFFARETRGTTLRWLIIETNDYENPTIGPYKAVRILVDHTGKYEFQVQFSTIHSGKVDDGSLDVYMNQMKSDSKFTMCPGVENVYIEIKDSIKRKPNKLREWPGLKRMDNIDCKLWYNSEENPKDMSKAVCPPCYSLIKSMKQTKKRDKLKKNTATNTPPRTMPLKFLTPKTRKRTLKKRRQKTYKLSKTLEKYQALSCSLNADQSSEMQNILATINNQFSDELNKLLAENNKGDIIRKIWDNDLKENKAAFMKDQAKNTGDTGNRFSTITYRVALAIFSRSPAAYEALKSFGILTLPSVSTLKTFMRSNVGDPGPIYERLAEEQKHYNEIHKFKSTMGQVTPSSEGALIFDEVKVTANIYWNAKSNKFIGHALSAEDMASMHDVYIQLDQNDKSEKASYILQFLWRDISSNVDVIGPYYTSQKGLDNKFMMACVLETIHLFFLFGFHTVLLICDGASANLKLLKLLCGEKPAVYSVRGGNERY